jgi:nucleoside 2-deoxyribosyltransferase
MIVFLSHSVSSSDGVVAARLRAVAAAYGIQVLLPDRTKHYRNNVLNSEARKKISQSDAVVALATVHATQAEEVSVEIKAAVGLKKPVIALVEEGVTVKGIPKSQVVKFDRANPSAHEHQLISVLNRLQKNNGTEKTNELISSLGWLAKIALGLVALNKLTEALADDK